MLAATLLARRAVERPGAWLAGFSALTAFLCLGVARLEIRTDGAAIYPAGDPVVERSAADRRTFRETDQVLVLLTSRPGGPPVDSPAGLRRLAELHRSLAEVPGVWDRRLRSLASLVDARPGSPLLPIRRLLDEIPEDARGFAELRRRIRGSELARGLFLAPGGRAAALYVPMLPGADRGRTVAALEGWAADRETADFELRLAGPVTAEVLLGRTLLRDLGRLIPIAIVVIAGLLFAFTGCVAGVLVPMAEVAMVLVWTLGLMGLSGVPITLVTTVLPVMLMTVAVADEIHLFERFRALYRPAGGGALADPDASEEPVLRRRAIAGAVRDVGPPIVLTSLTTAAGFLSLLAAAMAPVRHFGLFTAAGVLLAMVLSFSFVPALLSAVPARWLEPAGRRRRRRPPADPLLERLALRHPGTALAICLLLAASAVPGWTGLSVQDSWVDNFDPGSPLIAAERRFNAELWGTYRFDLVLTGPPLFFHRPEGLRLTAELTRVAAAAPHAGGVLSHPVAYRIAAAADGEELPVWELPAERVAGLARLLARVAQTTDLDQVVTSDGARARVRIFVKNADHGRAREIERHLERELPPLLAGTGVAAHFSGDLPVARAVVDAVVGNVLRSVGWTLAGVFLLLSLLSGSLRAAAVTLAPLAASVPILLGVIGYAGIPFGIATSMFTAVTLGVAVDFAIHLTHAYRVRIRAGRPHREALAATFAGPGRSIRWNAAVLGAGLLVLALSGLRPNRSLGLLLGLAMAVCYAATLLVLPAVLPELPPAAAPGEDRRRDGGGC